MIRRPLQNWRHREHTEHFEFKAEDTEGKSVIVRHDNRTGSSYEDFVKSFKAGDVISVTGIGIEVQ
ncbi:hypothetical protein RCO48_17505 [Peribacillus frigoritolerans]|nr:hypothetical protein [Peribacillus frigoritolerans]